MAYTTADEHYAPTPSANPTPRLFDSDAKAPPSPDSEAAADSSSLGLEEISSCSGGGNGILTPHLEQGFQLLCQLSTQNVSCLSDQSFQVSARLSARLKPRSLSNHRSFCIMFCESKAEFCIVQPKQNKI